MNRLGLKTLGLGTLALLAPGAAWAGCIDGGCGRIDWTEVESDGATPIAAKLHGGFAWESSNSWSDGHPIGGSFSGFVHFSCDGVSDQSACTGLLAEQIALAGTSSEFHFGGQFYDWEKGVIQPPFLFKAGEASVPFDPQQAFIGGNAFNKQTCPTAFALPVSEPPASDGSDDAGTEGTDTADEGSDATDAGTEGTDATDTGIEGSDDTDVQDVGADFMDDTSDGEDGATVDAADGVDGTPVDGTDTTDTGDGTDGSDGRDGGDGASDGSDDGGPVDGADGDGSDGGSGDAIDSSGDATDAADAVGDAIDAADDSSDTGSADTDGQADGSDAGNTTATASAKCGAAPGAPSSLGLSLVLVLAIGLLRRGNRSRFTH